MGPLDQGLTLLGFVLFLLKCFALFDAATRPAAAFPAAEKQTKGLWVIILSLAALWDGRDLLILQQFYFQPLSILSVVGLVAALVYVLDARPALRAMGGGNGRRQGPYGPY